MKKSCKIVYSNASPKSSDYLPNINNCSIASNGIGLRWITTSDGFCENERVLPNQREDLKNSIWIQWTIKE